MALLRMKLTFIGLWLLLVTIYAVIFYSSLINLSSSSSSSASVVHILQCPSIASVINIIASCSLLQLNCVEHDEQDHKTKRRRLTG